MSLPGSVAQILTFSAGVCSARWASLHIEPYALDLT